MVGQPHGLPKTIQILDQLAYDIERITQHLGYLEAGKGAGLLTEAAWRSVGLPVKRV